MRIPGYILFGKGFTKHPNPPLRVNLYPAPLLRTPTPPSPPLCPTRKCAQETAVPHVRPLAHGQVHPGNGAMCDRRHVADTVRGVVTVIWITLNFTQRQDKNKAPCYLLGLFKVSKKPTMFWS